MALSEIPRAKLGVGSGVFNTFRQIGFVLGVAILISLFVGQIKTNTEQARTNSSQIAPQSINLTQFAQFAPPQFREQARASLKILSDQIAAEFKNAVISAFTAAL